MALLHKATLQPSKLDLLAGYLRQSSLTQLGTYRFDDPAGAVGIETFLVADPSGATWHLPMTYRSEPIDGAEEWVIGKTEHSVLGTRWIHNACADPIYAGELLRAILSGGTHVEQYFETDEGREYRDPTASVLGTGAPGTPVPSVSGVHAESFDTDTVIDTGGYQIVVRHQPDSPGPDSHSGALTGTWADRTEQVVLAYLP